MKKTKAFITSFIIILALIIGVCTITPVTASATEFSIWVGGVQLHEGEYLVNGATETVSEEPTEGGYAHLFEGELILNNYEYNGVGYEYDTGCYAGIYSDTSISINYRGENAITLTDSDSYAICVIGDYTFIYGIESSDTLILTADYGIVGYDAAELYLGDGAVTINSTSDAISTFGCIDLSC